MSRKPTNQSEAKALGLSRFYTGRSCIHGHDSERMTSTRACVECLKLRKRAQEKAGGAESTKARKERYAKSERGRARAAERKRESYYDTQANTEYARKRRADKPGWATAMVAKRRAVKLQRTPAWADIGAIKKFYADCPPGMHVDHIIPLKGELVSGLHVYNNLQYLPPSSNASKCNSFDPWTFEP